VPQIVLARSAFACHCLARRAVMARRVAVEDQGRACQGGGIGGRTTKKHTMPVTAHEVVEALFARAPRELAESWDNVGLVIGDPGARVRRVLVCVDATEQVLAEARAVGARLVVAHHPPFLDSLKRVRADEAESAVAYQAVRAGVGICVMHTNLDYAPQGLCVELACLVGLEDIRPLSPAGASALVKLTVFVPASHVAPVRAALAEAGAGRIGEYAECSFGVEGEGTFRPLPDASPYTGAVGRLEQAREVRLEMAVARAALARVLTAMEAAHPYEEVAYDVYPLANTWPNSARGALGRLRRAVTLGTLARRIEDTLGASTVRVAGDRRGRVRRVAVGGGSGGQLVADAVRVGAEALVVGEVRHHEALRAVAGNLSLIEAGHFATERPAVDLMRRWLEEDLAGRVEITASRVEADPFAARQARAIPRKKRKG